MFQQRLATKSAESIEAHKELLHMSIFEMLSVFILLCIRCLFLAESNTAQMKQVTR